jgi:hypothetical protein
MNLLKGNSLAVAAAMGLSACLTSTTANHAQESEAQAAASQAAEQAADERAEGELREHHQYQHRGGVMQFIAMSLDTVGESDDERPQVLKVQRDLYACMAPAGEILLRLHLTVADGVAIGAVDLAKVDGIIGQLDAAGDPVRDCSVAALNQLHAILSPEERTELADKVEANLDVWEQVNSPEAQVGRGPRDRLGRLARQVELTPDQVDRAAAALHTALSGQTDRYDRSNLGADVQAFADTFAEESFDARGTTRYANPHLAAHGATRMVIFYETVTPLLTPAQRATLADQLRARAANHSTLSAN